MIEKKFSQLSAGDRFIVHSNEFVKVPDTKISCCKSINAQLLTDSTHQIHLSDDTQVMAYA